ncbi:hypothetical protein GUJ93_ZPchr0010g9762 [Zizania palustris]|uniref:Uncharacterized protein n=1 Tax=Zizania palustris TaxID=103762 RepID=A0A8J6BJJ8_ZIZPA|nr:hypothetical protein GUJ93_ZPchr0010g9762 [Zizania palustris]
MSGSGRGHLGQRVGKHVRVDGEDEVLAAVDRAGSHVADGEEECLATKDSAHTADLRDLASDLGGARGIGHRRPLEVARDSKGHGAASTLAT